METSSKHHFILVHGGCHGAWCWYKVKALLEASGHRVSAPDLSASGVNSKQMDEVRTLHCYTQPLLDLMDSIPPDHKVILVGHSLGGLAIALATDHFPHKVSAAVFLAAFMPDTTHPPSYVLHKYKERTPDEAWLDTEFYPSPGQPPLTIMHFGPNFMSKKLYQLSPPQDVELGKMLMRPSSLFLEDLDSAKKFTEEGFGSVKRVYVVCEQDTAIPQEFQRWLIENGGAAPVMEIKEADHMPMLSTPQQLCSSLLEIARTFT